MTPLADVDSRKQLKLISLEYAIIFFASGSMFPFFTLYLTRNLGWSGTQVGTVMALGNMLVLLTQPLWGRLADITQKNTVLALGLGASAVLAFLQPFAAGTFLVFVILRLLHSMSSGAIVPICDSIALDVLGDDKDAYGNYRLWGSFGMAVASFVFGKVYEILGFDHMFFYYAALMAIAAGIATRFDVKASSQSAPRESIQLRPVLANPALLMLLGGVFLVMTANAAGENFLAIYMDAIGAATGFTGYAFAFMAFVEVPMFLVAPLVIERFGYKSALVFSTALFGLKPIVNIMVPIPWVAVFLQGLVGIGFAFYQVSVVLMVDSLVPRQFRATGQAILATVSWSLAGIVGNLVFGRLLDTLGIFGTYRIGGCVGLLGALFIYLFVPGRKKQQSAAGLDA